MRMLLISLAGILAAASVGSAAEPFFLVGATVDSGTAPVLKKYLTPNDYLDTGTLTPDSSLNGIVPDQHRAELVASSALRDRLAKGCGPGSSEIVFDQPDDSIREAAWLAVVTEDLKAIRSAGCHSGLIVSPAAFGWNGNTCKYASGMGQLQRIDWSLVDYADIPGESLITDECMGKSSANDYVNFAKGAAAWMRAKNPSVLTTAHVSLRRTSPESMIAAMTALNGSVDGFLIAYPRNPLEVHRYASPGNLDVVLSAFRR